MTMHLNRIVLRSPDLQNEMYLFYFVNEPQSIVDEPQSIVDEPQSIADEPQSIVDEH